LHFRDISSIRSITDQLQFENNDQQERTRHYQTLGLENVNVEEHRITDYPGSQVFEEANSFQSMRKIEELSIFENLNNGGDINSIIAKPELKTVLNWQGVVKIGTRYFKYFDSGRLIVIGNNDVEKLNEIINLGEFDFIEDKNLRKLEDSDYDNLFDTSVEPAETKYLKEIRLKHIYLENGQIKLENVSFVEFQSGNNPEFSFDINGESFTESEFETEIFNDGDVVSVNVTDGDEVFQEDVVVRGFCEINNHAIEFEPCEVTINDDGTVTYLVDLSELWSTFYSDNYTSFVSFQSGAQFGEPLEITASTSGQSFTATLQWIHPNGWIACEATLTINIICPNRKDSADDQTRGTLSNGEEWRVLAKNWVDGTPVTTGNVGARTRSSKKAFIGWTGANADKVCVEMVGQLHPKDNCVPFFIDSNQECENNSGNVQNNYDFDGKPRLYTQIGKVYSIHSIEVDGDVLEYRNSQGENKLEI